MRLFGRRKEGERLLEELDRELAERDLEGDAETPPLGTPPVEPEPETPAAASGKTCEDAGTGEVPRRTDSRGFFDLAPGEVADYRPPAAPMAPRRRIPWKPVAKVAGIVAAAGLVVAAVILLWPSPSRGLPDFVGKTVSEAMESGRSMGYRPSVVRWDYSREHSDGVVLEQSPAAGKKVEKGGEVRLVVSKGARPEEELSGTVDLGAANSSSPPPSPYASKVVVIDPGHQALPAEDEWSDPDMTRKQTAEAPARGVSTGNLEDRVTLDIAVKLKTLLEKDGMKVTLTRETGDVDLPDTTRAEMANDARADLFLRVHTANSQDPAMSGVATLYPAESKYTRDFYQRSKAAALFVQQELVGSTGATDYGVEDRHDHTAFNWSHVPVIETEVGYLTSPADDLSLDDEAYRWKIAWGLRNGILKYFNSK